MLSAFRVRRSCAMPAQIVAIWNWHLIFLLLVRARACVLGLLACAFFLIEPGEGARAQDLFGDEQGKKCVEILGINLLAVMTSDPAATATKIRAAAEARSREVQTAIDNIKGDISLARGLENLSVYEISYLYAANAKLPTLQAKLTKLSVEIDCWRHLEKVLRLAKLLRPPPSPSIKEPEKKPQPAQPPVDPDPYGLDEIFKLAKNYFDQRAKELRSVQELLDQTEAKIKDELDTRERRKDAVQKLLDQAEAKIKNKLDARKRRKDVAQKPGVISGRIQQPKVQTRTARTQVQIPAGQTLSIAGLLDGPNLIFYLGGNLSAGLAGDNQFSVNPGNQSLEIDARKFGFGFKGGAIVPLNDRFALGAGVNIDRNRIDTGRLVNLDGSFANTVGNANVNNYFAEVMALFKVWNNITLRLSGLIGKARRNIDFNIGGVQALSFSDTVTATGFEFGFGVPLEVLNESLGQHFCATVGLKFTRYDEANGLSPTGVPITLGGFGEWRVGAGLSYVFSTSSVVRAESTYVNFGPGVRGRHFCP